MSRKIIVSLTLATVTGSAAAASATATGSASSSGASDIGSGAGSSAGKSPSSSTKYESSASFTGRNGFVRVDGDTIEARNGELRVNGIPYGSVSGTSVVKYTSNGKDKTLTVDGVPRSPLKPR